MNSAAVISRQIRNQSQGRVSTSYPYGQKTRSRASLHQLYRNNPSTSTATNVNRNLSPSRFYFTDHSLHKDDKSEPESRAKCTYHCLCVALKAMSGGLVLLIVGTTMSLIGFIADAQHNFSETLSNGTVVETPLPSVFRNLTFAGPVLMGLGMLVVIAALVLVFEVRDILGVKTDPVKVDSEVIVDQKPPIVVTKESHSNSIAEFKKRIHSWKPFSKLKKECNVKNIELNEKLQFNQVNVNIDTVALPPNCGLSKTRKHELEESANTSVCNSLDSLPYLQSATPTSLEQSLNIELTYFNVPSPQETDSSYLDGCSLKMPSLWQSSRCSCSCSPTLSSDQITHDQGPIDIKIIEKDELHQHLVLQQKSLLQKQPQQLQKPLDDRLKQNQNTNFISQIASIESDGLSSTSSLSSFAHDIDNVSKA